MKKAKDRKQIIKLELSLILSIGELFPYLTAEEFCHSLRWTFALLQYCICHVRCLSFRKVSVVFITTTSNFSEIMFWIY